MRLLSILTIGAATWTAYGVPILRSRATVCNGHAQLCNRSYSNVTFVGAHDSYANSKDPLALAADQSVSVTDQLNLGVRMLQAQGHFNTDKTHVELCHTSCLLFDGGSLLNYLKTVKTWLDANPNEVLTILVTNGDNIPVNKFWGPDFVTAGLSNSTYIPTGPGLSSWPTLGSMIDSGKRLVVFMDYNANTAAVPFILPEFDSIWETPFDVTNAAFPCKVDRGKAPNMALINHYLDTSLFGADIPDRLAATTTNSVASILADANGCAPLNAGRFPSFVLTDWVDQGAVVAAVNAMNGV